MTKHLSGSAFLILALLCTAAHAADQSQKNLVISQIAPTSGGVMVGFTTLPTDCTSNFKGAHAFINSQHKDFDAMYAYALEANVTKTPVKITYTSAGTCGALASLLKLSSIR